MFDLAKTIFSTLGSAPWLFAIFPAIVVVEHAIYLYFTNPSWRASALVRKDGTTTSGIPTRYASAVPRTERLIERSFAWWALGWRYGLPALLLALMAFASLYALFGMQLMGAWPWQNTAILEAAQLGAVGAYLSVLLYLARRVVRHDLTPGGAMLSATTLVLGPVLAGAVGSIVDKSFRPPGDSPWTTQALYLALGMAPRRFASAILEAIRKLWFSEEAATAPPPTRIVPLTQVRGITPDIEERLSEEGVYDVTTLAMADPISLYRNTSFELRQILCWMDEALLILFAPEQWSALEKAGISGAIDLATYGDRGAEALQRLAGGSKADPGLLGDLVQRLSEDAQVGTIWVLYQSDSPPIPENPPG
jgi:hypothetical protein